MTDAKLTELKQQIKNTLIAREWDTGHRGYTDIVSADDARNLIAELDRLRRVETSRNVAVAALEACQKLNETLRGENERLRKNAREDERELRAAARGQQ